MLGKSKRWFVDASPQSLAALRIVVGGYALMYLLSRTGLLQRIAEADVHLFDPVGVARVLSAPLPPAAFGILVSLTIVFGAAFVLGWGFRVSGPAFGALLLFVLCYRNSWSMVYHTDNLLVFHVAILGLTRAADAASVDRCIRSILLRLRRTGGSPRQPVVERWVYGWPIQLICAVTALSYFVAGIAKVASPLGWAWMSGNTIRDQVAVDVLRKHVLVDDVPLLAQFLFDHVWIFLILGVVALAVELAAPVAIISRRFSRPWIIVLFLMHWGILLVMGIKFRYQLTGVAFFSFVLRDFIPSTSTTVSRLEPDRQSADVPGSAGLTLDAS